MLSRINHARDGRHRAEIVEEHALRQAGFSLFFLFALSSPGIYDIATGLTRSLDLVHTLSRCEAVHVGHGVEAQEIAEQLIVGEAIPGLDAIHLDNIFIAYG
jgi:hypothetical protein